MFCYCKIMYPIILVTIDREVKDDEYVYIKIKSWTESNNQAEPISLSECQVGRTPALQQIWQSKEKSLNIKEKTQYLMNTLYLIQLDCFILFNRLIQINCWVQPHCLVQFEFLFLIDSVSPVDSIWLLIHFDHLIQLNHSNQFDFSLNVCLVWLVKSV